MIHLTKMFDKYCYAYFCRAAYIFAHLSAILSNFFPPPLYTRAFSRTPLVHTGSCRSVLPPVPTPRALLYLTGAFTISHTGHLFAQADMAEVLPCSTSLYLPEGSSSHRDFSCSVCSMGSPFLFKES